MKFPPKDPLETLDYRVDWSQGLDAGDKISTSTWTVVPANLVTVQSTSFSTSAAVIWLSGGTNGNVVTLTNEITTGGGRTFVVVTTLAVKTKT